MMGSLLPRPRFLCDTVDPVELSWGAGCDSRRLLTLSVPEIVIDLGIEGIATSPLECLGVEGYLNRLIFW